MSVNEKMTAIADNIRTKTGGTESLTLDDMANGVNEAYEAGKKKEWSDFWDWFQGFGERIHYDYAFYNNEWDAYEKCWREETFKPKYDICPSQGQFLFHGFIGDNLGTLLKNCGVKLDLSKCKTFNYIFNRTTLKTLPVINLSGATASNAYFRMFSYSGIETIEKLIVVDNGLPFNNTFLEATKLKSIVVEGVIGVPISFSYSPLTVESVISVITHLKDYSTDTTNEGKNTLTLSDASKKLMAEQGAISELSGKTYDEYITDIGWNLA